VFTSVIATLVFSVVFVVTGAYALVRLAALTSGVTADGDRAAELSHLLMSIAMVAMTWGLGGGPNSPSGVLQILVFGLLGLWFLLRTVRPRDGHPGRTESTYHLVLAVAMAWMVLAMPALMGGSTTGMADMPGMTGTEHAAHGGSAHGPDGPGILGSSPSGWTTTISVLLVVLLAAAALLWTSRALRPLPATRSEVAGADHRTSAGTATLVAPTVVDRLLAPRLDAACHLLMSLGMAAMLLAML
jgi:hypothetical protein